MVSPVTLCDPCSLAGLELLTDLDLSAGQASENPQMAETQQDTTCWYFYYCSSRLGLCGTACNWLTEGKAQLRRGHGEGTGERR